MDGVDKVGFSVFVPKGAGVFPFFDAEHPGHFPFAPRVGGLGYEEAVLGSAEVNVVHAVVISYGRGP